jgi:putative intracellular protease/amidase
MQTLLIVVGVAVLGVVGFGVWLVTLPSDPEAATAAPAVDATEAAALRAALQAPKRERPLIVSVGINDATETLDYVMPAGILRRADVADVELLATRPGPVRLFPALTVLPDATLRDFDVRHPDGADYVLVPAMSHDDDPVALAWIREQAAKGAIVIGVCAGAKVVGEAGLLDGRRATTHWYYLRELRKRHPTIQYVPDRRIVVDGSVATTTGITASMPLALTLIEAIAGSAKARAVAAAVGIDRWDVRHDSGQFKFTRPFAWTVLTNRLAFWRQERIGLALRPGLDEVSLALVADAWSRTSRSRAVTIGDGAEVAITSRGIRIVPDVQDVGRSPTSLPSSRTDLRPAAALDEALRDISRRYGANTARVVTMQMEYPVGPN